MPITSTEEAALVAAYTREPEVAARALALDHSLQDLATLRALLAAGEAALAGSLSGDTTPASRPEREEVRRTVEMILDGNLAQWPSSHPGSTAAERAALRDELAALVAIVDAAAILVARGDEDGRA